MVKAMTRSMNGSQHVITGREGCSIGHFLISHRHALPAKGVHKYPEPILEGNSATNVVRVPMRDEDTANTTPLCSLFFNGIKISRIVNRRINHHCPIDTAPQYNGIGTRP